MHEESKTKASACQHETTNKKRRRKYNKRREEAAAQEGEGEDGDKRSPFVRVNVFTEDFVTNEMFSRKMQCDVLSTK